MTDTTTESRLGADKWLDQLSTSAALAVMLDSQAEAVDAVRAALPQIEEAAAALYAHLTASQTGRLVYTGAGTSARIGVQDGAELLPTFDWPDSRTAFVIAGGPAALLQPVENAEDDEAAATKAVADLGLGPEDSLIGQAASGKTPFTIAVCAQQGKQVALQLGSAIPMRPCLRGRIIRFALLPGQRRWQVQPG